MQVATERLAVAGGPGASMGERVAAGPDDHVSGPGTDQRESDAKAYRDTLRDIEPKLKDLPKESPKDSKLAVIYKKIKDLDQRMRGFAAMGVFSKAKTLVHQLQIELENYRVEKAGVAVKEFFAEPGRFKAKVLYDEGLKKLRPELQKAEKVNWANQEMHDMEREFSAKKTEMESAATQGDYPQALKHLNALAVLVDTYNRSRPRDLQWINFTLDELSNEIFAKFLRASAKLKEAAEAYQKAIDAHQKALKDAATADALKEQLLIGAFFAAFGGAVGGQLGDVLNNALNQNGKRFLFVASNDLAKFTARAAQQLGGSRSESVGRSISLGGSGVDLARNFQRELDLEGADLLERVNEVIRLVKNKKSVEIVFEDPTTKLTSDPFLKVLQKLPSKGAAGWQQAFRAKYGALGLISTPINLSPSGKSLRGKCPVYDLTRN